MQTLTSVAGAERAAASDHPLAALGGQRPAAPDWYGDIDLEPSETLWAQVHGVAIEVLAWGERGLPGVLLAHGGRAHARWWGPVAPLLARDCRVVSISFSGSGGSGWREAYSFERQAEELFAAAHVGGIFAGGTPPLFAGHSFGARAVLQAMAARGRELSGAVLVDTPIMSPRMPPLEHVSPKLRYYDSLATGLSRFSLTPTQVCDNLFILDDIARASLVETEEGWRWRFDPAIFQKFERTDVWQTIARPACELAFVYGEDSRALNPEILAAQRRQAPPGTPFIGIPEAGHHIMIDQPIALVTALRTLMQTWLRS